MSLELIRDVLENGTVDGRCPLCGVDFQDRPATDEHIIPAWLQRDQTLQGRTFTLPNFLTSKYASGKIRICKVCNNETFSRIESAVKLAFEQDNISTVRYGGFVEPLGLWCAKVLWLMALKSHRSEDYVARREGRSERVLHEAFVEGMQLPHMMLRAHVSEVDICALPHARFGFEPMLLTEPYSLYIFEIDRSDERFEEFDYMDNPATSTVAVRAGAVGVVCSFDNGHHRRNLGYRYLPLYEHALHPTQFAEAYARIVHAQTCMADDALALTYYWREELGSIVVVSDWAPQMEAYSDDKHDPKRLATLIGRACCLHTEAVLRDDGIWTCLYNPDGSFREYEVITEENLAEFKPKPGDVLNQLDAAVRGKPPATDD